MHRHCLRNVVVERSECQCLRRRFYGASLLLSRNGHCEIFARICIQRNGKGAVIFLRYRDCLGADHHGQRRSNNGESGVEYSLLRIGILNYDRPRSLSHTGQIELARYPAFADHDYIPTDDVDLAGFRQLDLSSLLEALSG